MSDAQCLIQPSTHFWGLNWHTANVLKLGYFRKHSLHTCCHHLYVEIRRIQILRQDISIENMYVMTSYMLDIQWRS